ncbi:hypothetical protein D3C72_1911500 [compost metagenome]
MGRDTVQSKTGLRRGQQGVTSVFWFTACVGGHAGKTHVKLGRGHKVITAANDRTGLNACTDMDRGEVVNALQRTCRHHGASAARAFFGGLKDEFNRAVEL